MLISYSFIKNSFQRWSVWTGLFALTASVNVFSAFLFTDTEFENWTSFSFVTDDPFRVVAGPGTSSGSFSKINSAGNPGAYLSGSHTINAGDTIWTGGIKTDFVYDLSISGALKEISVAADVIVNSGSNAWQLIIEQDGQRYYSIPFGAFFNNSWAPVNNSGLTANDFDTNPWADNGGILPDGNTPDFTALGGQIQFGFMVGNRLLGSGSGFSEFGLDNFSVDVSQVPAPAAAWLFGSAIIGLTGLRKFKK